MNQKHSKHSPHHQRVSLRLLARASLHPLLQPLTPSGSACLAMLRCERSIMPGTYSQLLLHIVFSTKHREPWLTAEICSRLYPYIGGIIRAEKGVLYDIGGVEDHVHIYLRWRADHPISDLMRDVKARSSKWIHETFPDLPDFAWQAGYAVFSVSKSQEDVVKRYIAGQAEHHAKEDFVSELRRLLVAHGVEFEERYLLD
jgi:putative transposase